MILAWILLLSFIIAFVSMFIVSKFSWDVGDIRAVGIATFIVWWTGILFEFIGLTGLISMLLGIIISMVTFIKFLWFEPMPAFLIGILYGIIYTVLFAMLVAVFTG